MNCQHCGQVMTGHKRKFCDGNCRYAAHRARVTSARTPVPSSTCPWCGNTVQPIREEHSFCSTACRNRFVYFNRLKSKEPSVCQLCHEPFFPKAPDRTCFCCRDHYFQFRRINGKHSFRSAPWESRGTPAATAYQAAPLKEYECSICKKMYLTTRTRRGNDKRACSAACRQALIAWKHKIANRLREARMLASHEPYDPLAIFERDGWKCHLCGIRTLRSQSFPHSHYATIDHVVPLAKGGADAPSNVKCCCFNCNCHKGDDENWKPASVA